METSPQTPADAVESNGDDDAAGASDVADPRPAAGEDNGPNADNNDDDLADLADELEAALAEDGE